MGSAVTGALQQASLTVPIVFVIVAEPGGAGFVDSLAAAGWQRHLSFTNFEFPLFRVFRKKVQGMLAGTLCVLKTSSGLIW